MTNYQALEQLHHLLQEIQKHPTENNFQEAFDIVETLREPHFKDMGYTLPYYVYSDGDCCQTTNSFLEACIWYQEFLEEKRSCVHIVDGEGCVMMGHVLGGYYPLKELKNEE